MNAIQNPFVYDAANTLRDDQILEYYIDDHNSSRLIQSKKNVFLIGERGSGKSMTLMYNSYRIQRLKAEGGGAPLPLEYIGVVVPCNTPLTHKQEYKILGEFKASIVSEHFMSLAIAFELSVAMHEMSDLLEVSDERALRDEFEFVLGFEVPGSIPLFLGLQQAIERESVQAQQRLNDPSSDALYDKALSFSTLVIPLLRALRRVDSLRGTHFLLMIDDAHNLNEYQVRALNSWVAYRDRSLFSMKVASAKIGQPDKVTSAGGVILEGHDYITIDLEMPIQNEESSFGKLADKIVRRRLKRVGVDRPPEEFFPIHPELERGLAEAQARVAERARRRSPDASQSQISDYVYKHHRAEYFRTRGARANLPSYSGFPTIVYLSTGVVRNLLEPCWWMFDAALSNIPAEQRELGAIQEISPAIQSENILERSRAAWRKLQELDRTVDGCSTETARQVYNLFDSLAAHFRDRLLYHRSEPGAISFSISEQTPSIMEELRPLLEIAQKAEMLYVREGPAKAEGRREPYYVPNRILWPIRGLDPHGQHARASIKASVLVRAAKGQRIPFSTNEEGVPVIQSELFDDGREAENE